MEREKVKAAEQRKRDIKQELDVLFYFIVHLEKLIVHHCVDIFPTSLFIPHTFKQNQRLERERMIEVTKAQLRRDFLIQQQDIQVQNEHERVKQMRREADIQNLKTTIHDQKASREAHRQHELEVKKREDQEQIARIQHELAQEKLEHEKYACGLGCFFLLPYLCHQLSHSYF